MVTGGARGVGRAIAERLGRRGHVVVVDRAKAGIEGLTRALAVDYAPRGIRVNAVALGSIVTERYDDRLDAELRRVHPLGRPGRGEEVASVVTAFRG